MRVRPLTVADAEEIATWRYPGRYATYDVGEVIPVPSADFAAVERDAELIGYCCFGPAARVDGVAAEAGKADVGYGLRPDLTGYGLGREFVGAVLAHARGEFRGRRLRLLILAWNERSLRVAVAHGFEAERTVANAEGEFVVMLESTWAVRGGDDRRLDGGDGTYRARRARL
jgi:[ribosomal protein S18]-alanine N-acetyltransferase